jgi:tetratricopeptide (TPR) repeat protein
MRVLSLILLAAAAWPAVAASEVRVWQDTLTLPTYQEGPPNPNPPFDQYASTRFNYPYTIREVITDRRVDVAWRAVYLENEYLKCSVLPDIGGHLYTCIDKINGQSMFYANPSIKKAQIGYRGAWAAFGIEFNFPVSHNWVSMSPVDFAFRKHGDGTASVWVGNIDRPYGMQWTVELRLAPRSTVLEQRVTLYNRSDVRHRFYWWSNAGVRIWDDSEIWYPMRWAASHGFTDVETWPVDSKGRNLSVIRNQTGGTVSHFVHGSREPFMGVYHPHTQAGVAHYSDYAELPAKKIWSWGVDPDGLDWRRALSDDNSGYVEVQAGLMRNQETYAFLEPRRSIRFTEYWMPVRGIGGVSRANLAGVAHLRREGGALVAGFNANAPVAGAKLRILDGARVLHEEVASLTPERAWSKRIEGAPAGKLTLEVAGADGSVLLRHTEGGYDWSPASEVRTGPQPRLQPSTPLETATDQELNGNLLGAWATYTAALKSAPDDFNLRVAAGRLAVTLLRYADAVRWLEPAQARATYDPEIAYHLGLAYQGLGETRKARTQFETAQRMPRFRAAGSVKLAELLGREGDLPGALRFLEQALQAEPDDQRAREEWVAVMRALGRKPEAPAPSLSLFLSGDTGADPERVLGNASLYMRLGLWREALGVLSREYKKPPAEQIESGLPLPQRHPVVAYYRAFCRRKLGESPDADYAIAAKLPTDYVFPSGAQTLEAIEAAVRERPGDGRAHFLLGSLRMASGLVDEALAEWRAAARIDPAIPVLHANLGRALLSIRRDARGASEAFRAGLAPDPANTELYSGLGAALSLMGRPPSDFTSVLERFPDPARMPISLVYDQALSYAEAGQFDKARALFGNRYFPREEGGTNVRQVWIRVRALEAQAAAAAGRCEAALQIVDHIGEAAAGLDFTRDGLAPFLAAAPNQAALGLAEARCGREAAAARRAERLKAAGDPSSLAFGSRLARALPGYNAGDWARRTPAPSGRRGGGRGAGGMSVAAGMMAAEAGRLQEARELLEAALLAPDRNLSHHHARVALREALSK